MAGRKSLDPQSVRLIIGFDVMDVVSALLDDLIAVGGNCLDTISDPILSARSVDLQRQSAVSNSNFAHILAVSHLHD